MSKLESTSAILNAKIISYEPHGQVELRYLACDPSQRTAISQVYQLKREISMRFSSAIPDQQAAQQFLELNRLDTVSRQQLENRWNTQWSTSWHVGKSGDFRKRTLFQCSSGYLSDSRRITVKAGPSDTSTVQPPPGSSRRNPYDFTGCLAHAEVTERQSDGEVTRVVGIFDHNPACQSSVMTRIPAVPLHPHVYEIALEQLRNGASIASIQSKNLVMLRDRAYRDMRNINPSISNVRYEFLSTDASTLYRLFNKSLGVDVTIRPEQNLHNWLDPNSPHFKPEIRKAVFHYEARVEKGGRLKVCISTKEMDEAAWKYAHHKQLILDGTFGVCSSRLLLFIAMGVDENGKGVPLAFFLFSAPTGNQATHAGYNREILGEFLQKWKSHLSMGRTVFCPLVAITDTDTKERGALQDVWPDIWLLLCRFHLRQCWTNRRKKLLPLNSTDFWKQYALRRVQDLEVRLLSSTDYHTAQRMISDERVDLATLANHGLTGQAAAKAALLHIDYLMGTWMPEPLWQSWSQKGRSVASVLLKIPVEGVLPTTNHLESFNCALKRKYIPRWQHSGSRLRFDFLICILITEILPDIFASRLLNQDYLTWLSSRFAEHAGGMNLVESKKSRGSGTSTQVRAATLQLCWWEADARRNDEAWAIVQTCRLHSIRQTLSPDQFEATCIPSSTPIHNPSGTTYELFLHRVGRGHCTCPDFGYRGGACKHLRALRIIIDSWVDQRIISPFYYPSSMAMAKLLLPKNSDKTVQPIPTSHEHRHQGPSVVTNILALQRLEDDHVLGLEGRSHQAYSDASLTNSGSESESESNSLIIGGSSNYIAMATSTTTGHVPDDAVAIQVQQRVEHMIKSLLPRLHGLSLLAAESPLSRTSNITEFQALLGALTINLQNALLSVPPSISRPDPIQPSNANLLTPATTRHAAMHPNSTRDGNSMKRPHPLTLLPPSPEIRQKRKTSHSIM